MSSSDDLAKAVLEGRRAPPNDVALLGSSSYMSQVLKPHRQGNHAKSQLLQVSSPLVEARGRPTSAGGGLAPPPSVPGAATADFKQATSQALRDALDQTRGAFESAAPVHVRDLAATAEAKTKELTDREKEVLRYQVYTQEEVPNNPPEPIRTRVLELSFFPCDGTLRLFEPQLANSGLLQGPFARRHVATDPADSHAYGPLDFQIGSSITVYGRRFTFVDADQHTRGLLKARWGLNLAPAIALPPVIGGNVAVPGHVPRTNTVAFDMNKEEDPKRGFFRKAGDTRQKFMAEGAAMLRFEGEWCETGAPFSDRRRFALQYYLADDTMELLDRTSPYSSGGLFSKFLSRQRLPRMPVDPACASMFPLLHKDYASQLVLPAPEAVEACCLRAKGRYEFSKGRTMRAKFTSPITGRPAYSTNNNFSSAGADAATAPGSRLAGVCVTSSLTDSSSGSCDGEAEFVTAADLVCGGIISVYGRPLLLRSCDPFSVAFGIHSFGFDQRELFVRDNAAAHEAKTVPLPPHVGALALGSEEETRKNASKLIPTYRRERDFERYYQLGSKALRFQAVLDPSKSDPEDSRRRFVISFYLEDNTMSIGELTGNRPGHGPSVSRWLNRGRYRNPNAPPDRDAMAALGIKDPMHGALPTAVAAAYDRVFGVARDKIGYTESSGAQGYGGGIFGKAERVGAGGVGVGENDGIGIRDATLHSMEAVSRFFEVDDFKPGALVQLPHLLNVTFVLTKPDSWTQSFLAAREADPASDPKDIFVPENSTPVPAMPLEASAVAPTQEEIAASGGASPVAGHNSEEEEEGAFHNDCLLIAKILSGVMESTKLVIRQSDKHNRGYAPKPLVLDVLRRYGVQEPACTNETIERVLGAYTIDFEALQEAQADREAALAQGFVPQHLLDKQSSSPAGQRPAGGSPGDALSSGGGAKKSLSRTTFGVGGVSAGADSSGMVFPQAKAPAYKSPSVIGTMDDPLSGPFLRDFASHEYAGVPMIDFPALFNGLHAATAKQLALQPRIDKLLSQLRTALLSSRTHLRRVFRDLDVHGVGAITMGEFRKMLARHNLDVGISDAQMRVLLRRFEPASLESLEALQRATSSSSAVSEPAISWDGFVKALLEVETLSPDDLATFLTFVKGLQDSAENGVGSTRAVPQLKPHLNAVSSWTHAAADPTSYLNAASPQQKGFGSIVEARLMRPSTAPTTSHGNGNGNGGATSASFTVIDARRQQQPAPSAYVPAAPSVPSTRSGSIAASEGQQEQQQHAAPVLAAHPPGSSPLAPMSKAQARVTFGKTAEASASVPSHAVASTFVKAPAHVATVDVLSALHSRGPETGRLVQAMRDAFGRRRFDLYRALSLYDTGRKNTLTVPSFISAVTSAGLKLSRSELEAFQDAVSSQAGGADLADLHVDFGAFFDNLWSDAAAAPPSGPSATAARPRTAAPALGAY